MSVHRVVKTENTVKKRIIFFALQHRSYQFGVLSYFSANFLTICTADGSFSIRLDIGLPGCRSKIALSSF